MNESRIESLKSVCREIKKRIDCLIVKILKACIKQNIYILRMDGGICSQIQQYIQGKYLEVYKNAQVWYDLTWFDRVGTDLDGKHNRNYELEKLYPDLRGKVRSIRGGLKRRIFMKWFFSDNHGSGACESLEIVPSPPRYLGGYYRIEDGSIRRELGKKYLHDSQPEQVLNEENMRIYKDIIAHSDSVGVHVRRGDMVNIKMARGFLLPSVEYFVNAMNDERFIKCKFFLFSDEPDWVKSNVLPRINGKAYSLVDINGPENAYLDFFLIKQCRHFIASQGSMARFACEIRDDSKSIILTPEMYINGQ